MEYLRTRATEHITELTRSLTRAQKARARLEKIRKSGQLRYSVELKALQKIEGHNDVYSTTRGSLKQAIARAAAKFKRENGCTNIVAEWKVYALVPGEPRTAIELHEMYWGHYKPPIKGKK